jgi:hypothetical protein
VVSFEAIRLLPFIHYPTQEEINIENIVSKHKQAQTVFLNPIYAYPWASHEPLSANLPFHRLKKSYDLIIDPNGKIDQETSLTKHEIKTNFSILY